MIIVLMIIVIIGFAVFSLHPTGTIQKTTQAAITNPKQASDSATNVSTTVDQISSTLAQIVSKLG